MNFKTKYTFGERQRECKRILQKYPDRIPIIVQTNSENLILDKHKYLVPIDLSIAQFLYILRKRIMLRPEEGLYMFVNNTIVSGQSLLSTIYAKHRDECGFLIVTISLENTFG